MAKGAKDDNERLSHNFNEAVGMCHKSPNETEKSRDKVKPCRTSIRISTKNSSIPAILNKSKVSDEEVFPPAPNLIVKGRKRAHYNGDRSPKNSLICQLKRQKSMLSAEEYKVMVSTDVILSESLDGTKLKNCVKTKRQGRLSKSKSSCLPTVEKNAASIQSDPLKVNAELAEAQSYATGSIEQKIWTERYSPSKLTEMVLNSSDVSSILSWMKFWDVRSSSSCDKVPASGKRGHSDDYSFSEGSCDSSSSDTPSSWRRSAYLILGPTGCGKTCLVYTLASQFGFKVFELNPSSCRSGKEVMAQCSRVMISQHVSTEGLSASSTIVNKFRHSQKSTLTSFFQPQKQQPTLKSTVSSQPVGNEFRETSREGLRLNNKSLILFDEVDVLFDADRGFWVAVGKLLQMGRRPIIFTASDPTVIREIPVPFQICRLKPLQSPTLVKPVLQRICDSQEIHLTKSLMESLTRPYFEDCNCDIPTRISTTARELFSSREFFNIRQLIVRLQWLLGSKSQQSDLNENTSSSGKDLLTEWGGVFSPLFSFSWNSKPHRITAKVVEKPKNGEFGDIFDSDNDNELDKTLVEEKMDTENFNQVNISLAHCRTISSDVLSTLSRYFEMQGLLDICSTQNGRSEISRSINVLPASLITSPTMNLLTAFGDVCSAPLSGIDPEGTVGSFAGEEDWNNFLNSITLQRLKAIQEELISTPSIVQSETGERVGSYINEPAPETDLLNLAVDKAIGTLSILKAVSVEKNSGESLFQQEYALDYLPALRDISKAEIERRGLCTRRKFFHYFDQIGLRLPQNVREYLSR
ncbi:hypothetical protein ACTXT7_016420 [Hymenolepis weldensis]